MQCVRNAQNTFFNPPRAGAPQIYEVFVRKFGFVFIAAAVLFASACSGSESGGSSGQEDAKMTTEGWLEIAIPDGWETSGTAADGTWSVEGWSSAWMADLEDEEAGLLLLNGEYGTDGAAMAASRIVSDTYFGAFPGFATDGASWIEPEKDGDPRIRRVNFVYDSEATGTGTGVIWALEDSQREKTAIAVIKGADLSESIISGIENSLDLNTD